MRITQITFEGCAGTWKYDACCRTNKGIRFLLKHSDGGDEKLIVDQHLNIILYEVLDGLSELNTRLGETIIC